MPVQPRRLGLALVTAIAAGGAAIGTVAPSTAATAGPTAPSASPVHSDRSHEVRGSLAAPVPVALTQPDGSKISAVLKGDAMRHWYQTASGYSLVQDASKTWRYATGVDGAGQLVAAGAQGAPAATRAAATGEGVPAGLARSIKPTADLGPALSTPTPSLIPKAVGTQRSLVILTRFTNQALSTSAASWNAKFFGASNSVRDFYLKASYGKLSLTPAAESNGTANDGIVAVALGSTHPNFQNNYNAARGSHWLAQQAMTAANAYVNYASYDRNGDGSIDPSELHITIIAAGYETAYSGGPCGNSIWGHQWGLGNDQVTLDGKRVGTYGYTEFGERHCDNSVPTNHQATIGIMAHEMGHDLGWPDLYDIDFTSEGIGEWSLMASGSWGTTGSFSTLGDSPSYPDAWAKYTQGWIAPPQLGQAASRSLPSAATSAVAYRMLNNPGGADWNWGDTPATGEYFLVENRTRTGYDVSLPGCGIVVYHVNESRVDNSTDTNRLVDVEEADGLRQMDFPGNRGDAGDPWPGSANRRTFNNSSNPNSRLNSGALSNVSMQVTSNGCANPATATLGMPVSSAGRFRPVNPARVLDTRSSGKIAPNTALGLQVTGRGGIPAVAGVDSVVLNVTAVQPTAGGFATVYPGGARPNSSNLNFRAGIPAVANLVVAKVSATGAIAIYNGSNGSTHFLADVVGYYQKAGQTPGAMFNPMAPKRILDTRSGARVGPTGERVLTVRGGATGVPTNATGVVMNVTAASTTSGSYLTVYPNGSARPTASNINWPGPTAAIPNLVYSPIGTNGQVRLYNSTGQTHLLADVVGWFGPSGQYVYRSIQPKRVVDTRTGIGGIGKAGFGPGVTLSPDVTGGTTTVPEAATGVVLNTTVTSTSASSYLTVWPYGGTRPTASNLNWVRGQTVPNLVSTMVGSGGRVSIRNSAGGTHVLMDALGWYGL